MGMTLGNIRMGKLGISRTPTPPGLTLPARTMPPTLFPEPHGSPFLNFLLTMLRNGILSVDMCRNVIY